MNESPDGVLPLSSVEQMLKEWYVSLDLDLRRGNWLDGLVRFRMSTGTTSQLHVAPHVASSGVVVKQEHAADQQEHAVNQEEHVASARGTFLQAYFRRVADKLFHMQTATSKEFVPIADFVQVSMFFKFLNCFSY